MNAVLGRVSETGRISLPAEFRKALGLERGGNVVVEMDGGAIHIRSLDETVARAQELTQRLLGDRPDSDVDAFLHERRREAERE
ncbi:MAG TPA: AbrB/MazE/SpoVT family DNA-binding domain-containing protein [Acetobacteraceae bacterium]|nr:AbrB/MazE/SpoVT family DNA-binding domain-containing protein [Acetobacteraceae bacterium]